MAGRDLVRPSRDGDQFHYHWAARRCLQLLPGATDLVAVTIEGSSAQDAGGQETEAGEELIDVGLYFGAETDHEARLVRYIQLKHSTRHSREPWAASGLEKTLSGFAQRYSRLLERFPFGSVAQRFRFEFTTNRPIDPKLKEALADITSGGAARHPDVQQKLFRFTGLDDARAAQFFQLFSAEGGDPDLWAQRHLLAQDVRSYLPDADYEAPVQLKELVTRKATTEFASDPSIRRHDVLRALKTTEEQLRPAPCLIPVGKDSLPREQEQAILHALLTASSPLLVHADAGVGKSVLAARLAASMPAGSEAVLYDCFGDGRYRNALHFRHRHRDAFVQIANELAARGLCHPLIPSAHADSTLYMRAFVARLGQAVRSLRASTAGAHLCVIVDAADNAEIAAEEQGEPGSFVRDLIRAPLPDGVHLAFTSRTHRRSSLQAPLEVQELPLRPFTQEESARHLRSRYPESTEAEVSEFAFLTSSNPRVQALALSQGLSLHDTLKQLGPGPTTVERAISDLLDSAVARLRDQAGKVERSQIDLICQGLAVLRPLVPISVLSQLSGTSEGAVRSFALDLGRPLLLKGSSLHFIDEPAETWFRDSFRPNATTLTTFLERLRPLATQSSYAAAVLPQVLLEAGKLDELVQLALSGQALPIDNPLEKRDVEIQRLTFALQACLRNGRYLAAAKIALKSGAECAGEQRQNSLIQNNTDLAAILLSPDRIEEAVSRRSFSSAWMGSHHAYDAGLLSGRVEFAAEATSRLRMAREWLNAWGRRPSDERRDEQVTDSDIAELAMAVLRLRGPRPAAHFLRGWSPRHHSLTAGSRVGQRLIDLGQYEQFDALATAAGNDVWLLLGLAAEARTVGRLLPKASLARLLRLLADRRVKLAEPEQWNERWSVLDAVRAAVEQGLRVLPPKADEWAGVLRRYLPSVPPISLASRFATERTVLLRAYALEAALRGQTTTPIDVAPPDVRKEVEAGHQYGRTQDSEVFQLESDALLPWYVLSAEVACGRTPTDLANSIQRALKATTSADERRYHSGPMSIQTAAPEWFRILVEAGAAAGPALKTFRSFFADGKHSLWPNTLTSLCRLAARTQGLEPAALAFASEAYKALEPSRENAESRADSYIELARAILVVSEAEARAFFNRAVEIASRIGDENLARWTALLNLAQAAGACKTPRPRTAHRLARVAELTYEYVARDKYFDWNSTVEALTDLCASSAFAILSRWRDRGFGNPERLVPIAVYRSIEQGLLPLTAPVALGGLTAQWDRLADIRRIVAEEPDPARRALAVQIVYRYLRLETANCETWSELKRLGHEHKIDFPDLDRLLAAERIREATKKEPSETFIPSAPRDRRSPDWTAMFQGVDLADAAALRIAYDAVRTYDPPYEFERFFREALARVKIGREPEFISAITAWPDFGIFEARYLLDALPSPLPAQLSLRSAVRSALLAACKREPQRVQRRGWGAFLPFERLHNEGVVPDRDVVHATLDGFTAQADRLGATELFQLLDPLAATLSPEDADDALNFGLDLLQDVLQPEDGDGAWRPELQPPHSPISALAGYVWAGLGSPAVAERWRCAHAVRSAVELAWEDFLTELVGMATTGAAGPFVDQGLKFYAWHARQWLLIGLARGALDIPSALGPAIPLLLRCLHEEHVLIREFAARALRALVATGHLKVEGLDDLDCVNRPCLPEAVYSSWSPPVEDDVQSVSEPPDGDEKYYFGIDIGPYWLAPLGHAFGLTQAAVERRTRNAIRQHMGPMHGTSWREDARHTRRLFGDGDTYHSHGSLPKADDLSAYHAYHAMMIVAAALLRERAVRHHAEEPLNEFQDWLSGYLLTRTDGKWLFDQRDPRLVPDPPAPKGYSDTQWCTNVPTDYLDQKLATDDGMIVLWARWTARGNDRTETVSVRSALVSRVGSEALVTALGTASERDHFSLPRAGDGDDLEAGPLKLRGWVSDEDGFSRLDERDPWATGLSYPCLAPCSDTIAQLGLIQQPRDRTWIGGSLSDALLRSETWTVVQGYGREAETLPGETLSGDGAFVAQLLAAHPEDCLVLSVELRRSPPRYARDKDEHSTYPQRHTRYYLMGADGVAHALECCP